ncbi:sulfotransferase [Roseixanthobacter glucoisosaccharinicivorans]|uniref:sulfotransferase n=1 Tax=Roseixanthobacter glucoisosaccharinicivorans TaxID=3119923 RepID=UPI0037289A76
MPLRDPTAPSPFLLLGAGRGGSSLLAGCLERHPALLIRAELGGVGVLMGADEAQVPPPSMARLLDYRLTRFRARCDGDRRANPERIWGNKITTEQVLGLNAHNHYNLTQEPVLDRFVSAMTGYRFLFIMRDGRTCVDSKVRRAGLSHVEAARRWCASVRVLEHLSGQGVLAGSFRYEDLITAPEATLREVAACVGVAFDPLMLEGARSPILPADYRHGRFVNEKAAERPNLPPAIEHLIRPDLDRLGYA